MFKIIAEWFGQGINLPLIVTDITLFALGLIPALKIGQKKYIIYVMLTFVAFYLIAVIAALMDIALIAPYTVYLGAIAVLGFAGAGIGFIVRLLKKSI